MRRRARKGQSLIEFTFVGIPIIFVLISIFEISRGMWIYHTLAYSVKVGVRSAVVHGINCVPAATNNQDNCQVTMGQITQTIRNAAVGLDPAQTELTFIPGAGGAASTGPCQLDGTSAACTGNWPFYDSTGGTNQDAIGQPLTIQIRTPFHSAIAMFWPGAKTTQFGSFTLGATSTDYIQF
ncbi:MAG TPA: TadE/TadG family type IV pilus assembly protein [Bryobacteraceae bacterium]|nr:TadE/TadG family type IV pilus assembly protein [Bryobacteraceae bacterium]